MLEESRGVVAPDFGDLGRKVRGTGRPKVVGPSGKQGRSKKGESRVLSMEYNAVRQRERWSRSVQIIVALRNHASADVPMTTREVAEKVKLPLFTVLGVLRTLRERGSVQTNHSEGENTWWIPRKHLKEHMAKLAVQNAEAAIFLKSWTVSSISARKAAGLEVHASYPCVSAREESCS